MPNAVDANENENRKIGANGVEPASSEEENLNSPPTKKKKKTEQNNSKTLAAEAPKLNSIFVDRKECLRDATAMLE